MYGSFGPRPLGLAFGLPGIILFGGWVFGCWHKPHDAIFHDRPQRRYVAPVRVGPFGSRPVSTALGDAAERGDLTAVRRLLDAGVSPDAVVPVPGDEGTTALQLAAVGGQLPVVRLLLDRGGDVNAPDQWGGNALTAAVVARQAETVEFLIGRGADVNADDDGATALGYALHQEGSVGNREERMHYQKVILLLRAAGAHSSPD